MTSSGTGEVLFLVKSSRVREYHQQNLAILAAPDGANFEISYNRRWIQPGLAVAVGDGACIVFADSPYRDFEPIRWAVVERVDESTEKITLGIRVGSFTLGTERLTEQWRADADADYDAGRKETDKTRPYFLFSEPNPGLRNPNGWDEASAAWRDVRSRLDRNGFFDGSRFARLSRVETVEGLPIEPGGTVQVGTRLFAHLDIAAAAKPEAIVIESTPSGWAQLDGEITINDDSARVPLQVLASGNGTLRLNLMPEPMRSCRPAITLNAISDVATSTASSPSSVDAASVHRLVTALERTSALADDAWIDILQQHLIPMGGEDDRLLLNLAERCYNAGRLEETIASVAKMSQATPRSELLQLAASARLGSSTIDGSAFGRVPLEDHASLSLLISALAASPSAVVHELAPELWSNHLGLERVADLIDAVWGRIDDASIAAHAAELRGYSDMAAARRLITTRWPDPETIENAPLRTLIEDLGLTDETAPYLHRWIRVLA
ncbi:MAG: hypothetical protein KDB16_11680, partial [Acidimicrobiales bacterium]|nr:hypothetical protein [Acidimicrobiales bacterium]